MTNLLLIEVCDDSTGMPIVQVHAPAADTVVDASRMGGIYVDRIYTGDVSDLATGERFNVDGPTMTEEA